jgi:hypothetical protein
MKPLQPETILPADSNSRQTAGMNKSISGADSLWQSIIALAPENAQKIEGFRSLIQNHLSKNGKELTSEQGSVPTPATHTVAFEANTNTTENTSEQAHKGLDYFGLGVRLAINQTSSWDKNLQALNQVREEIKHNPYLSGLDKELQDIYKTSSKLPKINRENSRNEYLELFAKVSETQDLLQTALNGSPLIMKILKVSDQEIEALRNCSKALKSLQFQAFNVADGVSTDLKDAENFRQRKKVMLGYIESYSATTKDSAYKGQIKESMKSVLMDTLNDKGESGVTSLVKELEKTGKLSTSTLWSNYIVKVNGDQVFDLKKEVEIKKKQQPQQQPASSFDHLNSFKKTADGIGPAVK